MSDRETLRAIVLQRYQVSEKVVISNDSQHSEWFKKLRAGVSPVEHRDAGI